MTNEEINLTIEYLKDMQEGYIEGEGFDRYPLPEWYALNNAIEVLEQTRWIPVSEKWPDPQENGDKDYSDWVQVTINLGKNNDPCTGLAYCCLSKQKWYIEGFVIGEVIAWMPLPESYNTESEVQNV